MKIQRISKILICVIYIYIYIYLPYTRVASSIGNEVAEYLYNALEMNKTI